MLNAIKALQRRASHLLGGSTATGIVSLVVVLLGFFLLPCRSFGQGDTGRIAGIVKDASGANIPAATVTATRVESNATATVATNKNGEYIFPSLHTGHYNVSVEAAGFSSVTKEGYELDDNGAVTIDFNLRAGATEQVIVTTAIGETVNTQTGEVSHVIDGESVRDLALNGRNYLDLLGTLPGSVVTNGGDAMAEITSGSTTNIVLNGVRGTANGLYIDGMTNKDIGANNRQFNNVSIDSIDHVKVQTSAFSAQYGQSAGPTINVVTRSGTNAIHGTLFEHIRNNIVDASNYFSRKAIVAPGTINIVGYTPIPQHLRFNDFGGNVGGPIKKDRLFVFGGVEWKIIAQASNPTAVTMPLQSQIAGNFYTTKCSLKAVPAHNGLPGFVPPANCDISNQITPFGHALQQVYQNLINKSLSYVGTACSVTNCSNNNNTIYELPYPFRVHQYLGRVDWTISKRQNAYARWINDTHTATNPIGDGSLPTTAYHDEGPADNLLISHTLIVSPTSFNTISVGALWSSVNQTAAGDDWEKSTYGMNYTPYYTTYGPKLGLPGVTINGYTGFDSDHYLNRSHTTVLTAQDIFTKVAGQHQLRIGGDFARNRKDQNGQPFYHGNLNFTSVTSSLYSTGIALADALLGNYATYTEAASDTYGLFRLWSASAFVDDTWRALPRLSVNLGLRYEWMTPWTSQEDNLAAFYMEFYDPKQAVTVNQDGSVIAGSGDRYNGMRRAGNGVPASELFRVPNGNSADVLSVPTIGKRGFYSAQRVFAPRLGFAYDLDGNGATAIRGGAGLFYDTPQGSVSYAALNAAPYLQSISISNDNIDNLTAYQGRAAATTIGDQYAVDPHMQRSYIYQYNFGVQQQLAAGMFFQLTYVGNQGRHLLHNPDINGVDPGAEDAAFAINQNVNLNYLRPYKGYGAIYQYRTDADSNYNGLQANLNRRVGKGRFTLAYTWSKALATASADSDVAHAFPFSKTYYYSYATFDRRNIVSASYIFVSPALRQHNAFLREPFGSWMVTGTGRYQGGQRETPTATDTLGVANQANYAGLPVIYPHTSQQWYDVINPGGIVNFSAPAPGQLGNTPKGILLGPNYVDYDLSLRKTYSYEKTRLIVSIDSFNILNHPNFVLPSPNVSGASPYTSTNGVATSTTQDHSAIGITSANRPRNIQAGVRLTF